MRNSHSLFQKSRTVFDKTKTVCHTDRRSGKGRLTATDLLLFLPAIAMQIGVATAGSYVASTITFSNQMPTGVLIYKCQSPDCTKQKQLGNSGYITPVPIQYTTSSNTQNTLDPAPQAFIYEMGTYILWQLDSKTISWNSCRITVDALKGAQSTGNSACPGFKVVNTDPVVSINLYNYDGYIFPAGYHYKGSPLPAPPNPRVTQPSFGSRKFVIAYKGSNTAICLNIKGTFNTAPCSGDLNDIKITSAAPYIFTYGPQQNVCNPYVNSKCVAGTYIPNSAFVVSGIQFSGQNSMTPVGQQQGQTDYGGRFEFSVFPQALPAINSPGKFIGGALSTGVSTVDMSLVNGYNFGFKLYPNQPTICALAKEEQGPSHYNVWSASNPASSFNGDLEYCPIPQRISALARPAGCQSDATFATNTKSQWADAYNCFGAYKTAQTCPPPASDPPPHGYLPAPVPSGAPKPWRPYSQNLGIGAVDKNGKQVLVNAYTWAYQDFRGTFTCDGDALSYTLEIYDPK